jgi:CYTH domain-containing protein
LRVEIERRFLVVSDAWRGDVVSLHHLRDGLLDQSDRGKTRVRIDGDRAWLTIKGQRSGISRREYEYEIPLGDAEELLRDVCSDCVIEKTRSLVRANDTLWTVDAFQGRLAGIVWAEIELADENQTFERPAWIGAEVTADPRFRQSNLLALGSTGEHPITMAGILASGDENEVSIERRPVPATALHAG